MQQAVTEITEMAERLETSGLKREQDDAVIQAIANSIEKFAVTPEVLGRAFDRADEREQMRFDEQDKRIQRMFDERDKRIDQSEKRADRRVDQSDKRADERIEALDSRMGERIEHLHKLSEERFQQRDKRSDERFNQIGKLMTEKFALVHREVKHINERLDHHEKRFDGIDAKLGRITGWMVTLLVALVGTLAGVAARGMWL